MKYEIKYSPSYSLLEVSLEFNEVIVAEAGAMIYMSPQITVETRKRESESLWRTIKTAVLGGESFFVNEYIAEKGSGRVGFAPAPVGDIRPLKVEAGRGLILQKSAYLAYTEGIYLDTEWQGFKKGSLGKAYLCLKFPVKGNCL